METKNRLFIKRLTGVFLLICCYTSVKASYVTPRMALDIAKKYVTLSVTQDTRITLENSTNNNTIAPYYIFNDESGKGFVIVSGNDEMGEVLAYSTTNALDTLNVNSGVKLLLAGYKQTFETLKQTRGNSTLKQQALSTSATVSPLLTSKWGQGAPYNAKTDYAFSGCVATAVAQMMYYHKWPAQGQGKNEYIVNYDNKKKSADFSLSHYDWENMLPRYGYPLTATATEKDAVALLMSDIGIAVNMQYTPYQSGAYSISACNALKNHFDYSATLINHSSEGITRFAEIIREELLQGCPVYLSGNSSGGAAGHAWVTDGFDKNGLFHMNFGWDGQSDGYYSLTALSVSQSGKEFQDRPLTFGIGLHAIIARPNNGKYSKIDKSLLDSSPQLTFNTGGSLMLPTGSSKNFNSSEVLIVEINSFVNKGKSFKGDIGIAVFDSNNIVRQVSYSDDHENGGFTWREYSTASGMMGTDFLMNRPQSVKVDMSGLEDGYYRLVPICTELKDDNSWDEWVRMKKAPTMEIELGEGKGRVSEENRSQAGFQLMAQPTLSAKAEQGSTVTAIFTLKNLTGVPRDCYVKMRLLDENGSTAFETRSNELTEFDGFSEAKAYLKLNLPTSIVPKKHKVWLEMIGDDGRGGIDDEQAVHYNVNDIHDKETAYITIEPATEKPLMAKVQVFLSDDSGDKIESNELNLSTIRFFRLAVSLRTSEGRAYDGPITFYCEDIETKTRIKLNSQLANVALRSNIDLSVYSVWLRTNNLPISQGHTYRIIVVGNINEKEVELKIEGQPDYSLTIKDNNTLQLRTDISTGISYTDTSTTKPTITQEGDQLIISGNYLHTVNIFTISGTLVQRLQVNSNSKVIIPLHALPKGVYVVKIQYNNTTKIIKIYLD